LILKLYFADGQTMARQLNDLRPVRKQELQSNSRQFVSLCSDAEQMTSSKFIDWDG
jgi:hypothetical protein